MPELSLIEIFKEQAADLWWLQLAAVLLFVHFCWLEAISQRPIPPPKPPPELVTDMFYWLFGPVIRVFSNTIVSVVLVTAATLFAIGTGPEMLQGFGPVVKQPKPLITIELLLLMDLLSYWTHRAFHEVPLLWRFHALHHSAVIVRWSSAGRIHPVNELANNMFATVPCFLLGFPLDAALPLVPVFMLYAIAAHTQWSFTFGPLRLVFVSPRFHRWHHTHSDEGGNKNFANVFSLWDRVFGTFYLPEGRVPTRFGLDNEVIAENFLTQLAYPFRKPQPQAAAADEAATGAIGCEVVGGLPNRRVTSSPPPP